MPEFEAFEAELRACNMCGNCAPVCPAWQEIGWESASPRGKVFFMKSVELRSPLDRLLRRQGRLRLRRQGEPTEAAEEFARAVYECTGCGACEAVCATFTHADPGAMAGNSLECRSYHATNAAEDPAGHCRHAGPSGDGVCGGNCESFCTIAMAICTGDNAQWMLIDDCINDCQTYPIEPPYSTAATTGDSFACRMYHLTLASTEAVPHCSHIGPVSMPCTDMPDTTTTG